MAGLMQNDITLIKRQLAERTLAYTRLRLDDQKSAKPDGQDLIIRENNS
jgi:hypothetical protein